jgi:hypothetical protein
VGPNPTPKRHAGADRRLPPIGGVSYETKSLLEIHSYQGSIFNSWNTAQKLAPIGRMFGRKDSEPGMSLPLFLNNATFVLLSETDLLHKMICTLPTRKSGIFEYVDARRVYLVHGKNTTVIPRGLIANTADFRRVSFTADIGLTVLPVLAKMPQYAVHQICREAEGA